MLMWRGAGPTLGVKEARTLSGEEWPKATQLWLQGEARYEPPRGNCCKWFEAGRVPAADPQTRGVGGSRTRTVTRMARPWLRLAGGKSAV